MRDIIIEEIRKFLLEDKASDRAKTARNFLANKNYDGDTFVFVNVYVKKTITSLHNYKCKYILGVTRMAFNGDFGQIDTNNQIFTKTYIINKVDEILKCFCKFENNDVFKKINEDLDGLSAQGLIDKYYKVVENINKEDNDKAEKNAQNSVANKGYIIKKITSFEESKEYFKYVTWCVTEEYVAFNKYTEGGTLPFFFCLKDGYDTIQKPEEETGNPKDEYGLSMIAVVFNGDGSIRSSTTRWNHENDGNDNMFTMTELVDVVGGDIVKCKNDTIAMVNKFYDDIEKKLKSGKSLNDVFDSFKEYENINICELDKQYYILNKKNKFIYKNSFDRFGGYISDKFGEFNEGFCIIVKEYKKNYINTNGEIISNEWFDWCKDFSDGCGPIQKDGKWNFINKNGKIISNEWFDYCTYFSDGFCPIEKDGMWNYINKNGKIISSEWYDDCDIFYEGFGIVKKDSKYNYINNNGELLSNIWFDQCLSFVEGIGLVKLNSKRYYIDKNGNPLNECVNKSINLMKRMMLL